MIFSFAVFIVRIVLEGLSIKFKRTSRTLLSTSISCDEGNIPILAAIFFNA